MEYLGVLLSAAAGYVFGALWYMALSKQWRAAVGIPAGPDGKPVSKGPVPYIVAFGSAVLVAGMMRHIFTRSGIDTLDEGLISGLGIGMFLAAPWLLTCYGFAGRPVRLFLIDGGYAVFASAIIGAVLTLV